MKNLANYNDPDNIGSIHWFRTLVSKAKHIGEFIAKNEDELYREIYQNQVGKYGHEIRNIMFDLIEWQETNKPLFV